MFTKLQKTQRSYESLRLALDELTQNKPEKATIQTAIQRGYFTPEEDDQLWSLMARYLTIRIGFWEIINDMSSHFADDSRNIKTNDDWRHFLFGYAASCHVVRMARLLIDDLASHKLVQRKINEGAPQHRIPRKVFTQIYQSLSDTNNALKMHYMKEVLKKNQHHIKTLSDDETVGDIVSDLKNLGKNLHKGKLTFLKLRLNYLWHALMRRGAASKQKTSFFILEKAGRVIAEVGGYGKSRVTSTIQQQLCQILHVGDVVITRHDFVASNLFLPGYWPHAALYIGTDKERDSLAICIDDDMRKRWSGEICFLEAKKDGVLFRPLKETLDVDECIVIRPQLTPEQLSKGIKRALQHEGKGYNFDFDFFRSDQLVCTEVVFRAYDNLGNIHFTLTERAGRLSLSAEDLLDMAIENQGFIPVAAFGFKDCKQTLLTGNSILTAIKESYKLNPS